MKSIRIHNYDSRDGEIKSTYCVKKRDISFNEKPTPLDFDAFIPWFCLELRVPRNVLVTRMSQAEYSRYGSKVRKERTISLKSKSSKFRSAKIKSSGIKSGHTETKSLEVLNISLLPGLPEYDIQNTIPVTTYYDKRDRLVEIAIIGCPFPINRKVMKAINVCLPFHLKLTKFSIRRGGLNHLVLHEVSKLLPYSNITEICLDDTCVPGRNYSVLLHQSSKLKYLSLKRCSIHDEECKRIAVTLDLTGNAAKTIMLLDLASNNITDEGAKVLGEVLKNNRCLLYLNLSGNNISDSGAAVILKYLKEFPLSYEDVVEKKRRRFNYLKARTRIYGNCLKEAKVARLVSSKESSCLGSDQLSTIAGDSKHQRVRTMKKYTASFVAEDVSVENVAEKKTKEIMGEFEDPFKEENIKHKNDSIYAIGNLTLCYLNLAYNNLSHISIRKILDVLNYQCGVDKTNQGTGLLRVVLDGNNIPSRCNELDEILISLKKACVEHEQNMSVLSLTSSVASKRRT